MQYDVSFEIKNDDFFKEKNVFHVSHPLKYVLYLHFPGISFLKDYSRADEKKED